jgi:hypothetical protein
LEAAKTDIKIVDEFEPQFPLTGTIQVPCRRQNIPEETHLAEIRPHPQPLRGVRGAQNDAREISAEDMGQFLAWRKAKGLILARRSTPPRDPRFLRQTWDRQPSEGRAAAPKFRQRPIYPDAELEKFFKASDTRE